MSTAPMYYFSPLSHSHCTFHCTKMKFSIEDFFSKCDQIRKELRIWSHLLKKSLMENFVQYSQYFLSVNFCLCSFWRLSFCFSFLGCILLFESVLSRHISFLNFILDFLKVLKKQQYNGLVHWAISRGTPVQPLHKK